MAAKERPAMRIVSSRDSPGARWAELVAEAQERDRLNHPAEAPPEVVRLIIYGHAKPSVRITEASKHTKEARDYLAWQQTVAGYCQTVRSRPLPWGYFDARVVFYFADARHGDLSNCWKSTEDGLQYGGLIQNDKRVRRVLMDYDYDAKERVEIELREWKPRPPDWL